jgi:hypothetical protein
MTSDAELTGLSDDIEDLIAAHGAPMEDFIWEALTFYADQVLYVHAEGIRRGNIEVEMEIPMDDASWLPSAVAVLNALGWYEPEATLDGRAHEVDGMLADQKQADASDAQDAVAEAQDSAGDRRQAAFDFA